MNKAKYVKSYHRCVLLEVFGEGGKEKKMSQGNPLIHMCVMCSLELGEVKISGLTLPFWSHGPRRNSFHLSCTVAQ